MRTYLDMIVMIVKDLAVEYAEKVSLPIAHARTLVEQFFPVIETEFKSGLDCFSHFVERIETIPYFKKKILNNLFNLYKPYVWHIEIRLTDKERAEIFCIRLARELYAFLHEELNKDFDNAIKMRQKKLIYHLASGKILKI